MSTPQSGALGGKRKGCTPGSGTHRTNRKTHGGKCPDCGKAIIWLRGTEIPVPDEYEWQFTQIPVTHGTPKSTAWAYAIADPIEARVCFAYELARELPRHSNLIRQAFCDSLEDHPIWVYETIQEVCGNATFVPPQWDLFVPWLVLEDSERQRLLKISGNAYQVANIVTEESALFSESLRGKDYWDEDNLALNAGRSLWGAEVPQSGRFTVDLARSKKRVPR